MLLHYPASRLGQAYPLSADAGDDGINRGAPEMAQEENLSEKFVVFELVGTTYAIRSSLVQQMEMIEQITPVPNAPPALEGAVFSRGRVIPAINLRVRFGFERIPIELRTRLVVVETNGRNIGLLVDSAREFISIRQEAIQPPIDAISGLSGKYIEGIATLDDRIILILDLNEVISLSDILDEVGQPRPQGAAR
jgi:purine-binding chemotaxis protein CheW